ncbi:hypothetical protein RBS60_04825 [Sinomonas sp. ASV486]|uniref:TetR family transcriptional regulator n=1 Tax=Sinomonas puerhi TaxID=3238584 RepID=A0AB39L8I1_9MICC|nr:hypothetical protein [Sinomonas sp. ASV486]MDQ4489521.1 hypothetical protein [Sinomonas sp. ASV486]
MANRAEILDGIVDVVLSEMCLPVAGGERRAAIGKRARSAR